MRKIVFILAVLVSLPVAAFADWGFGGAAFYKSPVLIGQPASLSDLNVDQLSFGGDVRLKLGWFQAEGLLLLSAGVISSLNLYLDAGVALDVTIFRLSLGVGPDFTYNFAATPLQAGLNAQIAADAKIGPFSVGLSYIMGLNINNGIDIKTSSGLLGAHLLFWM